MLPRSYPDPIPRLLQSKWTKNYANQCKREFFCKRDKNNAKFTGMEPSTWSRSLTLNTFLLVDKPRLGINIAGAIVPTASLWLDRPDHDGWSLDAAVAENTKLNELPLSYR